jgi:hypothetical protein
LPSASQLTTPAWAALAAKEAAIKAAPEIAISLRIGVSPVFSSSMT